jgi:ABC-type cobalamin/Fe3+-siderophores transport system ATPase subunit
MVKLFDQRIVRELLDGNLGENTALKSALLQVLANIILKVSSSKVQDQAIYMLSNTDLGKRVALIMNNSFMEINKSPVIFEKGLKLFAALSKLKCFYDVI